MKNTRNEFLAWVYTAFIILIICGVHISIKYNFATFLIIYSTIIGCIGIGIFIYLIKECIYILLND